MINLKIKIPKQPSWIKTFWIVAFLIFSFSCKKLVETPPPTDVVAQSNVYKIDATAIAVLNGIYASMNEAGQPFQGTRSVSLLSGLSSDEFTLYSGVTNTTLLSYFRNSLSATIGTGSDLWSPLYNFVFKSNSTIEGLAGATSLTPAIKQQLQGEAKFLRAFYYFYLVNLFGNLPLLTSTDQEVNSLLSRSSIDDVYQQIKIDLLEAKSLLTDSYLDGTLLNSSSERVRPTKWAASALLARAYLYNKEYLEAEQEATEVINKSTLFELEPINSVFLKNSKEAIWQLQPTAINFNTTDAKTLIIPARGPSAGVNPVFLSKALTNSFEPNDQRAFFGNWVDTTIYKASASKLDTVSYSYKYKLSLSDINITSTDNMQEYFMILRLGEQYLIRAEARALQNNMDGAKADLNKIRDRAGLGNTSANDMTNLLAAILHERQVELFGELGHRWFDLKRVDKIDEVMALETPKKFTANTWLSFQKLYPIAKGELSRAPNLDQNSGY